MSKQATAKTESGSDRRVAPREDLPPLEIRSLMSIDHRTLLSRTGSIVNASKTGFLLTINRKDLVPKQFREVLSLDELKGDQVLLTIEAMNLEIGGHIVRTKRVNKEVFEIVVDYADDAPEYWREALMDMLPRSRDYED